VTDRRVFRHAYTGSLSISFEQLGLRPGAPLTILIEDDGLHVVPYEEIVREVQAAFAPYRQPGVSVVDGLIGERREEAACEERELEESNHEPR
jgi:hypothetical protein